MCQISFRSVEPFWSYVLTSIHLDQIFPNFFLLDNFKSLKFFTIGCDKKHSNELEQNLKILVVYIKAQLNDQTPNFTIHGPQRFHLNHFENQTQTSSYTFIILRDNLIENRSSLFRETILQITKRNKETSLYILILLPYT